MRINTRDNRELSTRATPKGLILALPPLCYIRGRIRTLLARRNPLVAHFLLLLVLYSMTGASALYEGALVIRGGIGILQNPPFFIHLVGGAASLPLSYLLLARILKLRRTSEDTRVVMEVTKRIRTSRSALALFALASFVGLVVLAYNIALGFDYEIAIYDSPRFPLTFGVYQLVRCYLYLFCYPLAFTVPLISSFYLFHTLRGSAIRYQPFHLDGLGGLRKFFVAVDRPIYAVQTVAVLIALMNYIGWGRMEFAPLVLAIAAPLLVTLLGVHLFFHFHSVVALKRQAELQKIRMEQMRLYSAVENWADLSSNDCQVMLDRLDATERLATMVSQTSRRGLQKYFFNLGVLVMPYVLRPLGEAIVERLMAN